MNRNLPHAEHVIRTALSVETSNQAGAVAHALDAAHLLVNPERTFGLVLHRTPGGDWARVPGRPTELEQQAHAWDRACERARLIAATVEQRIGGHPDFLGARADGDCVRVELHVTDRQQWQRWRTHFGIRRDAEIPLQHAVLGETRQGGVRVSVLAHERRRSPWPAPPDASAGTAAGAGAAPEAAPGTTSGAVAGTDSGAAAGTDSGPRTYEFEGTVYDLALPQRDAYGDVWYFHGCRTPGGMPLLSLDGRPERCTLANVTSLLGPLTALEPEAPSAVTAPPTASPASPTRPAPSLASSAPSSTRPMPGLPSSAAPSTQPTPVLSPSSAQLSTRPQARRSRAVRLTAARLTVVPTPAATALAATAVPAVVHPLARIALVTPGAPADAASPRPPDGRTEPGSGPPAPVVPNRRALPSPALQPGEGRNREGGRRTR